PSVSLEIDQVVGKHQLALEQVETVSAEAAAKSCDHSLRTALRNGNLGSDGVILVENARGATVRNAGILPRIRENRSPGGRARPRRHSAGQDRVVQRQHLV